MTKLKAAENLKDLRGHFASIKSTVAGDTRFSAQAILFLSERLSRIEALLEQQVKIAQQAEEKAKARAKRPPTDWQRFFAKGMKAGKTAAAIGAEWRERQGAGVRRQP